MGPFAYRMPAGFHHPRPLHQLADSAGADASASGPAGAPPPGHAAGGSRRALGRFDEERAEGIRCRRT